MSISMRLKTHLDENRIPYVLCEHSPSYTARGTAATLHVPGKEMAKTVVVRTGAQTCLAVLQACHHVDLERLSLAVGQSVRLATEAEMLDVFPDCELGAMPPLGEIYNLPVYVDKALAEDSEIVFNAGTQRQAIRMSFADFKRLARPTIGSFGRAS
jgi:Ala-tRNA(Pro) deacylase